MAHRQSLRVGVTSAIMLLGGAVFVFSADLRDREAVYVPEKDIYPIELTIKNTTAVYGNRSLQAHLRNFMKGDAVTLKAYHKDACLVRNNKTGFEGWVATGDLSEISPQIIGELRQQARDAERFAKAIEDDEVVVGMGFEHVKEVLGKPDEESFRKDASGRHDTWVFVEYDTILQPQTYRDPLTGQYYRRYIREKIPEMETRVEFTDGKVTALEKVRLR